MNRFVKVGLKWGADGAIYKDLAIKHSIFIISDRDIDISTYSNKIGVTGMPLELTSSTIYALAEGFNIIALATAKSDLAMPYSEWDRFKSNAEEFKIKGIGVDSIWVVEADIYLLHNPIKFEYQPGVAKINKEEVVVELESAWQSIKNTEPLKKK